MTCCNECNEDNRYGALATSRKPWRDFVRTNVISRSPIYFQQALQFVTPKRTNNKSPFCKPQVRVCHCAEDKVLELVELGKTGEVESFLASASQTTIFPESSSPSGSLGRGFIGRLVKVSFREVERRGKQQIQGRDINFHCRSRHLGEYDTPLLRCSRAKYDSCE